MEFKYIHAEEARNILESRQNIRSLVENWWAENEWGTLPFSTVGGPIAITARQVATARYEDCLFSCLAKRAGLTPVWAQLVEDQFFAGNPFKKSLVRGTFCQGRGRAGGYKTFPHEFLRPASTRGKRESGLPFEQWSSTRLADIRDPQTGRGLVDLHNEFLKNLLGVSTKQIHDGSSWYKEGERTTVLSFARYLSLFAAGGVVLFDDYHHGESGSQDLDLFRIRIFDPAVREIERLFGVQPLLVQLPFWRELGWYPDPTAGDWKSHGIVPSEYL